MGKGGVILCKGKRLFQLDSTLSDGDIYSLVLLFTGMLLKSSCIEHLDDKDGSYQICGDLYLGSLRDRAPVLSGPLWLLRASDREQGLVAGAWTNRII